MTSPSTNAVDMTPYSTVTPLLGALESYLTRVEGQRVASYATYEAIYWNVPNVFKIVQRGSSTSPIYVPVARTIIDTIDRYVGAKFSWRIDGELGTDTERATLQAAFQQLFVRERFISRYNANKLFGLIRGDWCWHVLADDTKLPGTRITIKPIDPAMVFKVTDPDDVDRVLGYDLIEKFTDGDKVKLKIQRYTKGADPIKNPDDGAGLIYSSLAIWDLDEFAKGLAGRPLQMLRPPTALPPQITALPVYHIPNFETPGDPWGSSELRGHEGCLAAINQTISDEDLAVALDGLGVYATTSGPPRDPTTNQPTNWRLGPGRVVELGDQEDKFERVSGVGSVSPAQDHLKFLLDQIKQASGATDAAAGRVEVTVAESGIALVMNLGPILAKADRKDTIIDEVHRQMFHDLRAWLSAYEQITVEVAEIVPVFGNKLPVNRSGEVADILSIVAAMPGLTGWGVRQLAKLGYDFTPDEVSAAANAQAEENRVAQELNATGASQDGAQP